VLLPALAGIDGAQLVAAVSGRGLSARHAAAKFGIPHVCSTLEEVLARTDVDAVIIATRHELHAQQAAAALLAGKDVFLEKPAAVDEAGLALLDDAVRKSGRRLMLGFNRRFSPFAVQARRHFEGRRAGLVMSARINAGKIPSGSWITDAVEGGGRIIGEACHFIDLMSYWAGAPPVSVGAIGIGPGSAYGYEDNALMSVGFADGSVGQLIYTSMGDPTVSKERYEIFCEGKVALLDNWRKLELTAMGRTKTVRALKADKGHRAELEAFVRACQRGEPVPMRWEEIAAVTRSTFGLVAELRGEAG
jgi:predicted dehydrogenase